MNHTFLILANFSLDKPLEGHHQASALCDIGKKHQNSKSEVHMNNDALTGLYIHIKPELRFQATT